MKRLAILLALMCLFIPNFAHAQVFGSSEYDDHLISTTIVYVSAYYGGMALLITAPISTMGATTVAVVDAQKRRRAVTMFLKDNATMLAHNMSMGGGQALTDLAKLSGVDSVHDKAFAKLARKRRRALVPLLSSPSGQMQCARLLINMAVEVQAS